MQIDLLAMCNYGKLRNANGLKINGAFCGFSDFGMDHVAGGSRRSGSRAFPVTAMMRFTF
jgi:hypothetical protein